MLRAALLAAGLGPVMSVSPDDVYVSGDEYDTGDISGAIMQAFQRGRQSAGGGRGGRPGSAMVRPGQVRAPFSAPPLPATPTQSNTSRLRSFLGLGTVTWTGASDSGDKQVEVEPQESFRGRRLIIDTLATGGIAAGLVVLKRIDVGTMPQSPSVVASAPVAMFRPDATDADLDLQIAYRGMKFVVTLGVTASPGSGVTVIASCGLFGDWVR